VADIFVSYTSADRDWAFWIGKELLRLGHAAHVHEWEISGGGDIEAWMEECHNSADHILCVVSEAYLKAPHSSRERRSAQWAIDRPNFALPVFVEDCKAPSLFANIKRCDLQGLSENDARLRLETFLTPAAVPAGAMKFPGGHKTKSTGIGTAASGPANFPGRAHALSNIPVTVPRHFLGRDDDLAAIDVALKRGDGRAAVTALHGLRGVGKTSLAAAFAERHQQDYRATWWIRAETDATMRADLVGLGVQLKWVAEDIPEETAVKVVLDRLPREGRDILLVYDNARSSRELASFLPRGAGPRIIITSHAPDWGGVASPVEIEVWPKEVGADFLIARTGRVAERDGGLALSVTLGGLPLAHEQAAAYCQRVGISLAEYNTRLQAKPVSLLDNARDATREYRDGLTVAKAFGLAIDEAAKHHEAAEALIVYAALLPPEPIPLYLFSEAAEQFDGAFALAISDHGLDEAVAALRSFTLVDRETIVDERDPLLTTDCIRLHRLVRQIAATRRNGQARDDATNVLIEALAQIFPDNASNPNAWPRIRRLDALALPLVSGKGAPPDGAPESTSYLLDALATYRQVALSAFDDARELFERALQISEASLGLAHPNIGASINNLAGLVRTLGDVEAARKLYERSLAISEEMFGADHQNTATCLNNLASVLHEEGDLDGAQRLFERALVIIEKGHDPDGPETAGSLNNLALVLKDKGDLLGAKPLYERALGLSNLSNLLRAQGDFTNAQSLFDRALAIDTIILGPKHPETATDLANLGTLKFEQGDFSGAVLLLQQSLEIRESVFGMEHSRTRQTVELVAHALAKLGRTQEAAVLIAKYRVLR
jgi:tetratricopeptide (TPR) repeat protein